VNEGADAIVISCSDAGKVTGAINDAVGRGLSVMTFDATPAVEAVHVLRCRRPQDGAGDHGGAGHPDGRQGQGRRPAGQPERAQPAKARAGRAREAAKHPASRSSACSQHRDAQDAAAEVIRVDNAYPEIQGWAMVGAGRSFTRRSSTRSTQAMKIVAVDALPVELPYVEKGLAPVLLAAVYLWGYVGSRPS